MYSLGKQEKLKSRKTIDALFAQRNSFFVFPIRVFWMTKDKNEFEVKAGFGCSKKYFKQAVYRNRAKRLMREAYRTQKKFLYQAAEQNKKSAYLFFLFANRELINFAQMQTAMAAALQRMEKIISKP